MPWPRSWAPSVAPKPCRRPPTWCMPATICTGPPTSLPRHSARTLRRSRWRRPSWCGCSAMHGKPRPAPRQWRRALPRRPRTCARCCWPSRATCGWLCCGWLRGCRRCAITPARGCRCRPAWPGNRWRCLRRWPTGWASGRSSGKWKTSLSASSSPTPTAAWPACLMKNASSARPTWSSCAPGWQVRCRPRASAPWCRAGPSTSTAS